MVPDNFLFLENWPLTSTGKTDLNKLTETYAANI
jgi:non-ribosomal peptide synthetase component E (peptide arylation enzyme)